MGVLKEVEGAVEGALVAEPGVYAAAAALIVLAVPSQRHPAEQPPNRTNWICPSTAPIARDRDGTLCRLRSHAAQASAPCPRMALCIPWEIHEGTDAVSKWRGDSCMWFLGS